MSTGEAIGLALGTLGFAVAIWQILLVRRQVKDAVTVGRATQEAVGNTERLHAVIELMRVIPQMQALEQDVASSVRTTEKDVIIADLQR